MTIIIRRPWTQQPQIACGVNWANPLTKDLLFLFNPATQSDAVLRRGTGKVSGPVTGPVQGLIQYQGNAAGYYKSTGYPKPNSAALTTFALFTFSTKSAFLTARTLSRGVPFTDATAHFYYYSGGNVLCNVTGVTDTSLGADKNLNSAFGTFDGSAALFSLNGGADVSLTISPVIAASGTQTYLVGTSYAESTVMAANASIGLSVAWSRILSRAERVSLHTNPWQLFAPRQIIIQSAAAAAGTYSLSNPTMYQLGATSGYPRVDVTVT